MDLLVANALGLFFLSSSRFFRASVPRAIRIEDCGASTLHAARTLCAALLFSSLLFSLFTQDFFLPFPFLLKKFDDCPTIEY